MTALLERVAGAPITWGVCEVPEWGHQLSPNRVFEEMRATGLRATELGPEGFMPPDPTSLLELLAAHDLRLVAGFVPIVLHRRGDVTKQLALAVGAADLLRACGADVMVLAAVNSTTGYEGSAELDDGGWATLTETLDRVIEIGTERALTVALHPHHGTIIEGPREVKRLLDSSPVNLCVDTGHLTIGGVDPLEVVATAAERVTHVHLKDVDRDVAEQVRIGTVGYHDAVRLGLYRPLGQGGVDVASVVTMLESRGYEGWYVLEQDTVLDGPPVAGAGPMRNAQASLEFLQVTQHDHGKFP